MSDFLSLSSTKLGDMYSVASINGMDMPQIRRLIEMGFVVGEKVSVKARSLSGQTYLISIRGAMISIRKALAKNVLVVKSNG